MKKINNKDLMEYTDKSYSTISGWNKKQPKLMEIVKLGAFCKKNDLDIEKIKSIIEFKEKMSN